MKRIIVFILIIFLLCGINIFSTNNFNLSILFAGASVEVYLNSDKIVDEFDAIGNGTGVIVFTNIDSLHYILNKYSVSGFTLKIKKTTEEVLTLISAENIFFNEFGVYGYCDYAKCWVDSINFNNSLCNFQIFATNNCVLLGFPILLGSY